MYMYGVIKGNVRGKKCAIQFLQTVYDIKACRNVSNKIVFNGGGTRATVAKGTNMRA